MSRILFVVISTVRHPFSIALLASNSFFFLVLYRSSIVTGILSVALYLMLMMSVSSLSATLFLILERRKMSPELTLVFATLVGLGGLAASLVFHSGTIINSVPLLSMCLDGIRSALTGDYAGSVVRLLELAAVPVAAIVIGWRLA